MNEISPLHIPAGHRWSDAEWALRLQLPLFQWGM